MGERFWEGVAEARSKHDNELAQNTVSYTMYLQYLAPQYNPTIDTEQLTAMSALSARTYSCGGEGARFFFAGGELCFAALTPCLK